MKKVIINVLRFLARVMVYTFTGTGLLYLGWNYGLVAAFPSVFRPIDVVASGALALFTSTVIRIIKMEGER